ncbi:MAG: diguanylate cyclase [Thermoleophilia bacterium]
MEAIPDAACLTCASGAVTAANGRLLDLTGRDAAEVAAVTGLPHPWWPGEHRAALDRAHHDALGGRRTRLELMLRRGAERIPVVASAAPVAGGGVLWVIHDATARLRSDLHLSAARDSVFDGFMLVEPVMDDDGRIVDGVVVDCNERVAADLGRTRDEHIGTRVTEYAAVGDVDRLLGEYAEVLRTGRPQEHERHYVLPPPVGERWFRYALTPRAGAIAVVTRDITARKRAEAEQARMAEQLHFISRASSDLVVLRGPDGLIEFVGDASQRLLGIPPERMVGTGGTEFAHPDSLDDAVSGLSEALAGGGAAYRTIRAVAANGETVPLDTVFQAVGDRVISISRDARPRLAAEEAARSRIAEQAALRRVATAAAAAGGVLESVMAVVAQELVELLGVEVAAVMRFEQGGARLMGYSDPHPRALVGEILDPARTPAVQAVLRSGRAARIDSYAGRVSLVGLAASAAAPVFADDRLWGVVFAGTREPGRLRTDAEHQLEGFSQLVTIAVQAAEARELLAAQAVTDPLTGLANHRAFQERLRQEVARARRHGRPLSLAMIDLDHFKAVNDVHGHPAGDAVLAEVAARLAAGVRNGDLVARIGGEEFAWLLPDAAADEAADAVERLRAAVSRRSVEGGLRVTLSAGVCDLECAHGSADELVRLADTALYWAKGHGRDQTCRYSPRIGEELSAEDRAQHAEGSATLRALRALAAAVDAKDGMAAAHSERVAETCRAMALALGWAPSRAARLREAAMLHDVGKIGVSDALLRTSAPLTPDERRALERHAELGAEIAAEALDPDQCTWIRHHHERWDGGGYPDGLSGTEIPAGARILAVADSWDVMVSGRRAYSAPRALDDALDELDRHAGTQFCPVAVDALRRLVAAAGGDLAAP